MPATYDKLGIRFIYPENWKLDESEVLDGDGTVSVYTPGGGFWTVIMHPAGVDPDELIDAAVVAMRAEYDELDADEFHETINGHDVACCGMNFFCLDLTNTAVARSFATAEGTLLVMCQADDREYEEVGIVFDGMTRSLLDPEASVARFVDATKAVLAGEPAESATDSL